MMEKGVKVTFVDVAGGQGKKLRQVIEFLKTPEKSHATHEQ
jgi:ATP-dependent Zn protease